MARPTKLTLEVRELLLKALRGGVHREVAATLAGICESTLYKWLKAGREARNGEKKAFFQAVKKAEAEWELEQVLAVREVAEGGQLLSRTTTERKSGDVVTTETYSRAEWTARAWLLERKIADRWAKRDRIDITIRQEAERVAKELGLDVDAVIAEAERIATG